MNYRPLTYLTCPYTHPDHSVSVARFEAATKATAWLMRNKGWNVLSPITHSHPLHEIAGMRGDWEFWKRIDTEFIGCSSRIVNLVIPGWHESVGVTAENKIAAELLLDIWYLIPVGPDSYLLTAEKPETEFAYERGD